MLLTHLTPDGIRRSRHQSLTLYGLEHGVSSEPALEALSEVARLARTFVTAEAAIVNLLPAGRQVVIASTDPALPGEIPERHSICSTLLEQRPVSTIGVPDLAQDARFADNPYVTGELGAVRGFASTPLIGHERVAIGTLCVLFSTPRTLSRDEASLLDQLARAAVTLLDDARRDGQVKHFPARVMSPRPAA